LEGGLRVPMIVRWHGHVPAGTAKNGIMSRLDGLPTFVAAARGPNIAAELRQGKHLNDSTFKVHLDGYDQTNLLTGKGLSDRHELFYYAEGA
jgi:arylsulfatase A-like enzyme